jgi:hypothetical protein
MHQLLEQLQSQFPTLSFTAGTAFYWSPFTKEVFYKTGDNGVKAAWSLLHETGHAILEHQNYTLDFELVTFEVAAWECAQDLAVPLNISIDNDHIQDCLDTYRDWLYARSQCPNCGNKGIQQADARYYHCFNCNSVWKVAPSRFCRAYRMIDLERSASDSPTFDRAAI